VPVDFLTAEQERHYGRFAGLLSPADVARYFHLDDRDRALIAVRRGDAQRLGFGVQIATVRYLGVFLSDATAVPATAVAAVAAQLGIADPACLSSYAERPNTPRDHAGEIQRAYGYRDAWEPSAAVQLTRWLYARAWVSAERLGALFDLAVTWLVERKILLPGLSRLTRLIAQVRERANRRFWRRLAGLLTPEQSDRLEQLVIRPTGEHQTPLDRLRRGPTRPTAAALVAALHRLREVRALGVGALDVRHLPPGRLLHLARYAQAVRAQAIARMPEERRHATLLAFAIHLEVTAQDEALDVLTQLVKELFRRATQRATTQRLRTLGDLDTAALRLREACAILLDPAYPDHAVRATAFARVSEEALLDATATVAALTRPPDDPHYRDLRTHYTMIRRFLPALLRTITFVGIGTGRPVVEALVFLARVETGDEPDMVDAPLECVSPAWRREVVQPGYQIDRRAYTFCVLEALAAGLRRHDIFVTPSERWADQRTKLLSGAVWEALRPQVCRSLGRSADPVLELRTLQSQLDVAYRRTAENLADNAALRIERVDGHDHLVLTPLERLEDPPSLRALRAAVAGSLPQADQAEVVLEVHARTHFADAFTHVSEAQARVADLAVSIGAVLVAEACNIGLEPLIRADVPALTQGRLEWIQQNYIRAETLAAANARIVDYHARLALAQAWGGGEVASADGLRFVVPVRSLHSDAAPLYFGTRRGATYYNFVSNQFSGFYGLVAPGAVRDAPYILAGLLEQQTSLRPTVMIADTGAYTDAMFALFYLLGYQFSPRLADLAGARYWRMDHSADYGPLNDVARHHIDTDLIAENWDDLLRVAGSLHLGVIGAVEYVRSLQGSGRSATVARALTELGQAVKTVYLLSYVDDSAHRRLVLTQMNRQESRHSLARVVFHGQRGELHQAYCVGQEDQLNALGLILNVLIVFTTEYEGLALDRLRAHSAEVRPEDVARLSPLVHRHLNVHGRHHFTLAEPLRHGAFRPLRDLDDLPPSNQEPNP